MALNDCGVGGGPFLLDTSFVVPSITLLGITLSLSGTKIPALKVTWGAISNLYVTHVEIELQPSDLSAPVLTERGLKEDLGRTITNGVLAGKDLTVRYRAVGTETVGNWSSPVTVPIPADFISSDVSPSSTIVSTVTTLSGTVSSNYTTLSGMVSSEATIRLNADNVLTSNVSTVTSTVAGHTSTLTTYGSTLANINGSLAATWGVLFDVNGRLSGLQLQAVGGPGTVVTTLKLYVNALLMYNPATNADEPFLRADATGLFIGNDRVVTESVGVTALAKGYVAQLGANLNWPTTAAATQVVFSVTGVVKDMAASDMRVQIAILNRAASQYEQQYALYYTPSGGTKQLVNPRPQLTSIPGNFTGIGVTARSMNGWLWLVTGLPAGTYTFSLEVTHADGWTAGTGYFENGSLIEIREAKRAA